eukprot:CAMPEP_0180557424 /NCGR_PEP_ID=MMETSP1037_2-20121125/1145_1 /TAXON_ID=632150 /ORGANISM="Azadinium spinosum, Strain 3D9" /LENGTH=55 /DNA_ID=CAMNT_0022573607 /DNA_START=476 /DNA_END=639 /DNA_ORIENTATION=+
MKASDKSSAEMSQTKPAQNFETSPKNLIRIPPRGGSDTLVLKGGFPKFLIKESHS